MFIKTANTIRFNLTASQAYSIISHTGPVGASNYLLNGKNTKADLSAGTHPTWTVSANQTYLFRIVNSAAQNMWWMHFDQHTMTVIAADFVPIVPYTTDWLAISIGQRYDVLITTNQKVGSYFFRAVTQTACPSFTDNTGLGSANGIIQYAGANSSLPTSTYGNKTASDFATCQDEPMASLVPYVAKSAGSSSAFTASVSTLPAGMVAEVATTDDGRVMRWYLNGGSINVNWTQPTLELLAANQSSAISNVLYIDNATTWVYFVIQNQFFMGHPMHLHGHDFALLGQGEGSFSSSQVSSLNFVNPTRRDTALLMGGGYTIIGFETDNPGAWLMHCHIAWHVDGGLALEFVEREDAIPAQQWTSSTAFQDQCSAYATYQEVTGNYRTSGESGLRKRNVGAQAEDGQSIVRKSERSEKTYLDSHVKRNLGDGYKPRHHIRIES